ncbi:hypothetical protein [Chryseobacterium indoltheticum]|uniref:DUF4488 domain-containing protein n=1 Tax=Chryseobacterium indoltheticum TaxID=254 RepID=A0A381FA25_9FLAO|nr:hypothetical protein [Chryseobacterium indoltheticum]AZA73529.1 hypothetical protein EG358_07070 [Chryseobacterium indoltheticum]SIR25470.1 hypothetical protein SAMN05421682_115134 [Chryseobacterium indoltheticum]SUX43431.1 Uncharacterised protein [Chryseobacterium indoltheticum]
MKKIKLLILISLLFNLSCSDSSRDETIKEEITSNIEIPQKYKGNWKVAYYTIIGSNSSHQTNDKGYYINFNNDNTITFKDINGIFTIKPQSEYAASMNHTYTGKFNNIDITIYIQDYSNWYQGGFEFQIRHGNVYTSNVSNSDFYAKKQ